MSFSIFKTKPLKTAVSDLAHDTFFNTLIEKEYKRVLDAGQTYLDFTGGNLYPKCQLDHHFEMLNKNVLGNPHSTNPTSRLATELVEASREKVLAYFNADDYFCVFTQNASGALKIVGECYPFDTNSYFVLLADNHNSVNGIREFSSHKGGMFEYCPIQYEDLRINENQLNGLLSGKENYTNKLFAFPAQSNVSGVKHDLEWIEKAHEKGWDVLLDAAAFVPTSKLDLSVVKPDFVSVSFYKIFGYPTGIGCLLVRKDKFDKLVKPWFAGGTVTLVSVQSSHHYLANNHERFEDGTLNYLDIPAIKTGLEYIESIGIERVSERVSALATSLFEQLSQLEHDNGKPLVRLFGPTNREHVGGTLIMNFFDSNGNAYPFEEIERLANDRLISIRSGCFCNPGIDEINNCLSTQELATYFSSRENGNYYDMIDYLKKMRGATRVSVGIATRKKDLATFVSFVESLLNK